MSSTARDSLCLWSEATAGFCVSVESNRPASSFFFFFFFSYCFCSSSTNSVESLLPCFIDRFRVARVLSSKLFQCGFRVL